MASPAKRQHQGDEFIVDPATIIDICVYYFKEFIDPQLLMINVVSRACHEFYDVVGCIVHDLISHELDEVDTVFKAYSWLG